MEGSASLSATGARSTRAPLLFVDVQFPAVNPYWCPMLRGAYKLIRRGVKVVAAVISAEFAIALFWPVPEMVEYDPSGELGEGSPLHIVVLGDSTVAAPGLDSVDHNWTRVMSLRLADRYRVKLTSLAISGSRVKHLLDGQLQAAVALRPDVIFVSVGANDVFRWVPVDSFRRDLDRLVARLIDVTPLVVLSGVGDLGTVPRFFPPLDWIIKQRGRRFDEVHRSVAEKYGAAKAQQWGWSAEQFRTDKQVFAADRFHASGIGHAVWAEVAWETLRPLLESTTTATEQP